ncbi:MAG: tryptophan 7-halogenase [Fuerstiella sp.]|nr:tryptophan 7-halogenase [Fuerstiella sp.]
MNPVTPQTTVDYLPSVAGHWDVIVIGGGPAGATTAALVAEYGHRVLLLERSTVPRFHVGESLIPETWWTLRRLGLLQQLTESAFPRKYSVQFVSDGFRESAPFYFDLHKPHESSVTWQVIRSDFDRMILDRARELGTVVHTSAQVTEVLFDGERATGVRVQLKPKNGQKTETTVSATVVVDATGQSAFISNRRRDRVRDPYLRKGTVWGYFRGAQRDSGRDEGATLIMQTGGKKSWFWYIPLPDDLVSVGCTGDIPYLFGKETGTPAESFARELARCPAMAQRLTAAEQCGDFFTTRDFSYYAGTGAGSGWLLVGDAFGFVDPVYSSGVFLALKGGEFAADSIHEALERGDTSGERLGQWQPLYKQGIENFRQLAYAFYAPDFSFASFLKQYPQFHSNLVDILVGDVFKPGVGKMFEAMGHIQPPVAQ